MQEKRRGRCRGEKEGNLQVKDSCEKKRWAGRREEIDTDIELEEDDNGVEPVRDEVRRDEDVGC